MPGIYKLFTALVALTGNISLMATGEVGPVFSVIGAGLLVGYFRLMKGYSPLPKWAVGSLSLVTFLVFLIDLFLTLDMFVAVAQMTLVFQTIKSFDIKEPWDPLQVFFVSLLQLLMASELTNALSFGIAFLVFLIFIVVSILLGHFVREGQMVFRPYVKPTVVITVLTLVLTVVFFVSIPRFRSGLWGKSFLKGIKTIGFSERVDFGSFGDVKLDETVVMRVILQPDLQESLYLRGMTFDYFDGIAWYDTIKDMRKIYRTGRDFIKEVPEGEETFAAEIYLEPINSDVIFTLLKPYKIDAAGYYMRRDNAGSFYMRHKKSKRFFYRIFSIDDHYYDNVYLSSYLQFPEEFTSIRRLAEDITSGVSDGLKKTETIRDYLIGNYQYSLSPERPADGLTAIEHFLFNSRQGYCEHFATSMALMLRSLGIPARLVTGFLRGSKNDYGDYYLIRQADAHSWVETFLDGRWVLFDPTPPVVLPGRTRLTLLLDMMNLNWYRYVVGFSSYDQQRMTSYLFGYRKTVETVPSIPYQTMFLAALIGMVVFIFYKFMYRDSTQSVYRDVTREYNRLRRKVLRCGGSVTRASTSGEVMKEALKTGRFDSSAIQMFISQYRFLRFSGQENKKLLSDFYQVSKRLKKKSRSYKER
jgi:transglutaminase-like putative cysteine protease